MQKKIVSMILMFVMAFNVLLDIVNVNADTVTNETQEIITEADAHVQTWKTEKTLNYGASTTLRLRYSSTILPSNYNDFAQSWTTSTSDTQDLKAAYLRFDLSGIDLKQKFIKKVELKVDCSSDWSGKYIDVYPVPDVTWTEGIKNGAVPGSEGGITFQKRPQITTTPIVVSATGAAKDTFASMDVTDYVKKCYSDGKMSVLLMSNAANGTSFDALLYSKEAGTSKAPRLLITYYNTSEITNDIMLDNDYLLLNPTSINQSEIELPTIGNSGSAISWESSDPNIISITNSSGGLIGKITNPPDEKKSVTLKATLTKDGCSPKVKTFTYDIDSLIDMDYSTLTLPTITNQAEIALPNAGITGSSISWVSGDPETISITNNSSGGLIGKITYPADGVKNVTLLATITRDGCPPRMKTFTLDIKAQLDDAGKVAVDKASLNLDSFDPDTVSNSLPSTGNNGSTITWALKNAADSGYVILDTTNYKINITRRPGFSDKHIILVATITKGAALDKKEIDLILPPIGFLMPEADAGVKQTDPSRSVPSNYVLDCDGWNYQVYMRFDLSEVPDQITGAQLRLNRRDTNGPHIDTYFLNDDSWTESISYNTSPIVLNPSSKEDLLFDYSVPKLKGTGAYTMDISAPTIRESLGDRKLSLYMIRNAMDTNNAAQICSREYGDLVNVPSLILTLNHDDTYDRKLTGTYFGSESGSNGVYEYSDAFDGDLDTYFDGLTGGYCGIDLGERMAARADVIEYAPAPGKAANMVGGVIQGSNVADFSTCRDIYTITTAPEEGVITKVRNYKSTPYRYYRYYNSSNPAQIAEFSIETTATASEVAAKVTSLPKQPTDYLGFVMPTLQGGCTASIKYSSNPDIVALDGSINPPSVDTSVTVQLTIKDLYNDTADTGYLTTVIPAGSGKRVDAAAINVTSQNGENIIRDVGGTLRLTAGVVPANTTNPEVEWSLCDLDGNPTTAATISTGGMITANRYGIYKAVAKLKNGSKVKGEMIIFNQFPQINCENFDGGQNVYAVPTTDNYESSLTGRMLDALGQDDYAVYKNVLLDGIKGMQVRVSSSEDTTLEIREGSITGKLLSTVNVAKTGTSSQWTTASSNFTSAVGGIKDIYIVSKGSGVYLNWIDLVGYQSAVTSNGSVFDTGSKADHLDSGVYKAQVTVNNSVYTSNKMPILVLALYNGDTMVKAVTSKSADNQVTASNTVLNADMNVDVPEGGDYHFELYLWDSINGGRPVDKPLIGNPDN